MNTTNLLQKPRIAGKLDFDSLPDPINVLGMFVRCEFEDGTLWL